MPDFGKSRAIVIGGSMSGLLAALLLRKSGWDVDIYERVDSELSGRGAGIVVHRELVERLEDLGLSTENLGVHVAMRKIFDADGNLTLSVKRAQVMTAWERVYRLLRDAFPPECYHRGRSLDAFTQSPHSVSARFSNGETIESDLLVGADGIRSTVRRQCLPEVGPLYSGYTAWRAMIAENSFPADVRRELFDCMAFGLPPGEQFLGYPVAGPDNDLRTGHRRYNLVWYRPAEEIKKLPWLLTDERGVTHSVSIPPPLIRREAVEEMRTDAQRLLAPQFRQAVRLIDEPMLQPIYDLESPRIAFGRVAIIGDAAFVARPHVGAGVLKAADDAAALVNALQTDTNVVSALKSFEAARLKENYRIIEQARHLGAFLQATQTEKEQALAKRHSTDAAVLAETASIDFLRP